MKKKTQKTTLCKSCGRIKCNLRVQLAGERVRECHIFEPVIPENRKEARL